MIHENEKQLVAAITRGDEKSLLEIYNAHHKALFQFVYHKVGDKQLAEELTNDIFLQFIESLRDFRFQASLKTFLFTIARNKIIDYFRKKKIKKILFSALPSFVVDGLASVVMEDELDQKELSEKIDMTLESLPHEYQVVLRLKYMEQKSVHHIAEVLVKTFKSTESLLYRARRAFMEAYQSNP
jgi:RNA polymerase sigma-70 factor (ECF subfamily)